MYSGPKQGTQGPGEGPGHVPAARAGALSVAGSCGGCYILFNSSQQQSCIAYKMQYLYYIQHESIYPFCEYHGEKSILHIYHKKC